MTVLEKHYEIQPCHPRLSITDCTCYSKDQLHKIGKQLLKKGHKMTLSSDKKDLWKQVDAVMRKEYGCQADWCWISTPIVKDLKDPELLHQTFRPRAPDDWLLHIERETKGGRYAWLSNFDIDAVLAQYQELSTLTDFKFYKSVPIDFEKIKDPLSRVNIFKLRQQGVNKFSVVFNLDEHDMPGSHWVALHCDVPGRVICFFDSYGKIPEREIQDFMAKICVQAVTGFDGKKCDSSRAFEMIPLYNATRFQRGNSECAVFSLYMIISMLREGGTADAFDKICSNVRTDAEMNNFRKRLFIDAGK